MGNGFRTAAISALIFLTAACSDAPTRLSFENPQALRTFFQWSPERQRLVSAHRGGGGPGVPENSMAAFNQCLMVPNCIIECDVRLTRDSVLVIFHDDSLQRASNRSGAVDDFDWAELRTLQLRDHRGRLTASRIPSLEELLRWARGKTVLTLDIKRGVPPPLVVAAVQQAAAEAYVIIIAYTAENARTYLNLNSRLMISVTARTMEDVRELFASGLPLDQLVCFTGVGEAAPGVYAQLHARGIFAIQGTMGEIDRSARRNGPQAFLPILHSGADILATDEIQLAAEAIRMLPN